MFNRCLLSRNEKNWGEGIRKGGREGSERGMVERSRENIVSGGVSWMTFFLCGDTTDCWKVNNTVVCFLESILHLFILSHADKRLEDKCLYDHLSIEQ